MSSCPTEIRLEEAAARLTIAWDDGATSVFSLKYLRGWCPCAHCQGHFQTVYRFQDVARPVLKDVEPVGAYAIRPVWLDGHNAGIYAYDYLRRIEHEAPGEGPSNASLLTSAG